MPDWLEAVNASLNDSVFKARMEVNRRYMESLDCRRLMANYYLEAGLTSNHPDHLCNLSLHYGGWEEPDQQVRGSFTGHYLSAAALMWAVEGDAGLKMRAEFLASEMERCGREHLDGWCMSIPLHYLDWIMRGKHVWAPQYMVHKTLMGLVDAYKYAGSHTALSAAEKACDLLYDRVKDYDRVRQDQMLKWETGGLMEVFADLYGITGKEKYRVLLERYCRYELFEKLLAGEDALTHMHANTTIPEAHGCARAYEVTGEERFRRMAEAFWHNGVEQRGAFATGGQNSYELWLPEMTGRIGERNQEFCTVYNLIRLADYLLRWSGEAKYADYIEGALYNGALAQQNKKTGANAYFLPLGDGSRKQWNDLYNAMYCCNGTTVQAQATYGRLAFYRRPGEILLAQYIPCKARIEGAALDLAQRFGWQDTKHPDWQRYTLTIKADASARFALRLRKPAWAGDMEVTLGDDRIDTAGEGFISVDRVWQGETTLSIAIRWPLRSLPLSPADDRRALMWGPVVLAGLAERERRLNGDPEDPDALLRTAAAMDHHSLPRQWITRNQRENLRFMPLYEVTDETYTVYFPFK